MKAANAVLGLWFSMLTRFKPAHRLDGQKEIDMLNKNMLKQALAAVALCAGTTAGAQQFPTQPITLMIPYPPGGSADMLARPLLPELQKQLGQPVVLENKAGAGGTIATAALARAANRAAPPCPRRASLRWRRPCPGRQGYTAGFQSPSLFIEYLYFFHFSHLSIFQ